MKRNCLFGISNVRPYKPNEKLNKKEKKLIEITCAMTVDRYFQLPIEIKRMRNGFCTEHFIAVLFDILLNFAQLPRNRRRKKRDRI